MTEAELERHLDAADKSPKEIAAAVSGPPDKILHLQAFAGQVVHFRADQHLHVPPAVASASIAYGSPAETCKGA